MIDTQDSEDVDILKLLLEVLIKLQKCIMIVRISFISKRLKTEDIIFVTIKTHLDSEDLVV